MPVSREVEVADVYVVLKRLCADRFGQAVGELQKLGMRVTSTDPQDGVVEGTLPTDKLAQLKHWDCAEDVRIGFTYISEEAPPDPDESPAD